MQPDNNIEKKLQEMENQSLPDLSKMDDHWRQMKQQLGSSKKAFEGSRYKFLRYAVSAAAIVLLLFLFRLYNKNNDEKEKQQVVQMPGSQKFENDSVVEKLLNGKIDTGHLQIQNGKRKKQLNVTQSRIIISEDKKFTGDVIANPIITEETSSNNLFSLEDFFNTLKKKEEEFVVDNRLDTVVVCKNGTYLLLPANIFLAKEPVVVTVKEFYSYEDIVTNRLTTTSNGNQLITAGMIHISVKSRGKELSLLPGKSIRIFLPDTSADMKGMQLFYGAAQQRNSFEQVSDKGVKSSDTVENLTNNVNWVPQYQNFSTNGLITQVKVLDLRDEPAIVRYGKKTKAVFYKYDSSKFSKQELVQKLKERYPEYDKITIRKSRQKEWTEVSVTFFTWREKERKNLYAIGDTAWVTERVANRYKLPVLDKRTLINSGVTNVSYTNSKLGAVLSRLNNLFSVEITSLGWINCDRFYNDARPKVDYIVNIKDTAANYYTMLVFDRLKSSMTGYVSGNSVVFPNLPEGEPVKIISIGIENGKPISAFASAKISKLPCNELRFEETSPEKFRQSASFLDKK